MTDQQQHPITIPPEQVQKWLGEYFGTAVTGEISDVEHVLATRAARWGTCGFSRDIRIHYEPIDD